MIVLPQMRGILASAVGGGGGGTDPDFASVVQLSHFEGANGSTTLNNSAPTGNPFTCRTTSVISTANAKWGASSFRVINATDGATSALHVDYAFGTSDWTVEWWMNQDQLTPDFNGGRIYLDGRPPGGGSVWAPTIYSLSGGDLYYFANGADRITGGSALYSAGTWVHIAASRVSNVTRLFVDGVQIGSNFADSNTYVAFDVNLGCAYNGANSARGFYDDFRMSNGIGRYSANFTPPAAQFPDS